MKRSSMLAGLILWGVVRSHAVQPDPDQEGEALVQSSPLTAPTVNAQGVTDHMIPFEHRVMEDITREQFAQDLEMMRQIPGFQDQGDAPKSYEDITIFGTHLSELPCAIGSFRYLKTLSVFGHNVSDLPDTLFNLTRLESLSLHNNQLVALPGCIAQLSRLTSLNLAGNQLSALPTELGQLESLTSLNLSSNRFTSVPDVIEALTRLGWLYLGQQNDPAERCNKITQIPEWLGNLKAIRVLGLPNTVVDKSSGRGKFDRSLLVLRQLPRLCLLSIGKLSWSNGDSETTKTVTYFTGRYLDRHLNPKAS